MFRVRGVDKPWALSTFILGQPAAHWTDQLILGECGNVIVPEIIWDSTFSSCSQNWPMYHEKFSFDMSSGCPMLTHALCKNVHPFLEIVRAQLIRVSLRIQGYVNDGSFVTYTIHRVFSNSDAVRLIAVKLTSLTQIGQYKALSRAGLGVYGPVVFN